MFIYPSKFEGFGIPIIEALQCGVPVIAAKGSCLEEAGGHTCIYVEPDDAEGMANAINTLLNEDKNEERISAGKKYVERFHQEKIAKDLMKVYDELMEIKK
jgi:glycosyltransferase involved in cell wall biosynthesis